MTNSDWAYAIFIFGILPLSIIIYIIIVLNFILQGKTENKVQKQIDKSIVNVINSYIDNSNYEECLYEIELIMRKLVPISSSLIKRYDSVITLLETFLVNINSEKCSYENDKIHFKQSLIKFINTYKQRNPLEEIKGVNFAILKELLDNKDEPKNKQLINQLAIELKQKDDAISNLQCNNKKSELLSKMSIILTIIFGIIAIIQAF